MSKGNNNGNGTGIGIGTILFIVFLVLKLTKVITWSWWWVTAPLWIPGIMVVFGLSLIAIAAVVEVACRK